MASRCDARSHEQTLFRPRLYPLASSISTAVGQVTATHRYHLEGQLAEIDSADPVLLRASVKPR